MFACTQTGLEPWEPTHWTKLPEPPFADSVKQGEA